MSRLALIGLDGFDPDLVFNRWIDDLPNLKSLMDEGVHGRLASTVPPAMVPGWTAMMTSRDPGQLGLYGHTDRHDRDYDDLQENDSYSVRPRTVWNHLSRLRLQSFVFGVPQTWPPKPLKGQLVSGPFTPNKEVHWTHPREIAAEVDRGADGDYVIDVRNFRTENKDWLIQQVYEATRRRFAVVRRFVEKKEHDFMMMVEPGADRVQHGFWRYMDPECIGYEKEGRLETTIHDYYVFLDQEVGRLLNDLPIDTSVMVASCYGAKRMKGSFRINDWLMREKLLKLKKKPEEPMPLDAKMISWPRTSAWAEGGFIARIYLNVQGRESKGAVAADSYEGFRDELKGKLEAVAGRDGTRLGVKVYKPEELYREVNRIAPDLIAVIDDYHWQAAGSVGNESLFFEGSEMGPNESNHGPDGIFIWDHPAKVTPKAKDPYSIYDIAPTILEYFGIEAPEGIAGESLFQG